MSQYPSEQEIQSIIARNVRNERERSGLTAEQVADQLNRDPSVVYRYERGESAVNSATLTRLAQILGVNIQAFFVKLPLPKDLRRNDLSPEQQTFVNQIESLSNRDNQILLGVLGVLQTTPIQKA